MADDNDEYYTQLQDIENELRHYTKHFYGKTVLCNCDDPKISNFFVYFVRKFNVLGLKRLITTCYKNCQPVLFSKKNEEHAVYLVYDGGDDNNPDVEKIAAQAIPLKGDGDFRSKECIELLKQADIVVTNPPFSLINEYVQQLMRYDKKFLIIGPQSLKHYSATFPQFRDNKIWMGYGFEAGNAYFETTHPERYGKSVYNPKTGLLKFRNCCWYTNLDHDKRHEFLDFYKHYNEEDYPHYDNFDGIDVERVADIPDGYWGMMGVPDNFLDDYSPEQFEIIGIGSGKLAASIGVKRNYRGRTDITYTKKNGQPHCPYSRIIIRRIK